MANVRGSSRLLQNHDIPSGQRDWSGWLVNFLGGGVGGLSSEYSYETKAPPFFVEVISKKNVVLFSKACCQRNGHTLWRSKINMRIPPVRSDFSQEGGPATEGCGVCHLAGNVQSTESTASARNLGLKATEGCRIPVRKIPSIWWTMLHVDVNS